MCDRVGSINKGERKYVGPTRDIIGRLTHKKISLYLRGGITHDFSVDHQHGSTQEAFGLFLSQELKKLNVKLEDVVDIKTTEGTLEEAFVKVLSI